MREIHVYHEHDLAAAREAAIYLGTTPTTLLREVSGAIAEARALGRQAALLEAADELGPGEASDLLRELADACEGCGDAVKRHSQEPGIGCLVDGCDCRLKGTSEADQ